MSAGSTQGLDRVAPESGPPIVPVIVPHPPLPRLLAGPAPEIVPAPELSIEFAPDHLPPPGLVPQHLRLFLTTGVLGGFTTFSAFSLDAALLFERHSYAIALTYMVGSVVASVVALFIGLALFNGGKPIP